jgi:hypothetical protein
MTRAAKTKEKTEVDALPAVTSLKGLNSKFQCRGFQFEIGKTYSVSGKIEACENGFHACPDHPFDVWDYYALTGEDGSMTRYALVEQSGAMDRQENKIASASITIKAEISLPEFIKRGVEYILAQANWKDAKESNTGYQSAATNTGDQSAATVEGKHAIAIATGYASRCEGCHLPPVKSKAFFESQQWLPPNEAGERYLHVEPIAITHIGTDPAQAEDMKNRTVSISESKRVNLDSRSVISSRKP